MQLRNNKNNVRPMNWKVELRTKNGKDLDLSLLTPTPFYNMAILEDIVIPLHREIIARMGDNFPNVNDAILLFKVIAISFPYFYLILLCHG
jgi:hypothetical protein